MNKIYYENLLANQNKTAKTDIVWVADITSIDLVENKKVHFFLCLDAHTNTIIASSMSQRTMNTQSVVRALEQAIKKRFTIIPEIKAIIHTDRGTQFSSKQYYEFTEQYKDFILPSMSRPNTPTDNSVAERFMRTFKNHFIENKTVEQAIQEEYIQHQFLQEKPTSLSRRFRKVLTKYVTSLNKKPNRKVKKAPDKHDKDVSVASKLMRDPLHPKAFSERFGDDGRLEEIFRYKKENSQVINLLKEYAARKAEIVDKTPFDTFENALALEVIQDHLNEIYELIKSNPETVRSYVQETIQDTEQIIRDDLKQIEQKIDTLLPKVKPDRQVLPLRDPISNDLLPFFLKYAGHSAQRQADLRRAQLRIAYTILYYVGLRINEIRHLTQEDIQKAIAASQFNLVHHKTKQAHIHILSKKAVQDLKSLETEFKIVFEKYQFKYLFGKNKPLCSKHFITVINQDLKHTCERLGIPFNIKSHSFRINMITNLLKVTSVQNTASIIGHNDIRSTMVYNRYALSKSEIQNLLDSMND